MFGPLAFVPVRQQKDNPAGPLPFGFRTHDELVNDDLSAIYKIAELRFPKAKHVRIIERITIVKSQHSRLRQHAVVDTEPRLPLLEISEGSVTFAGYRIVQNAMALTKCPAPAILAR